MRLVQHAVGCRTSVPQSLNHGPRITELEPNHVTIHHGQTVSDLSVVELPSPTMVHESRSPGTRHAHDTPGPSLCAKTE